MKTYGTDTNPILELFGCLKNPPRPQTEEQKKRSAFEKIYQDCKKALEVKNVKNNTDTTKSI